MPKVQKAGQAKTLRHNPLADDIMEEQDSGIRKVPRNKARGSKDDDGDDATLDAKMAQKLLKMTQAQKKDEDEIGPGLGGGLLDADDLQDDNVEIEEIEEIDDVEVDEDGNVVGFGAASEEDQRALAMFLPKAGAQARGLNLSEMILQKIQEHETKAKTEADEKGDESGLSPKVVQVYGEIGTWLKTYKSGKLPKAFKVLPSLVNWEEVLALTNPLSWSAAAMYEAVNIFASNLNPKMAQRFFNLVLLPAVRENILKQGKLKFAYYRALRKSLFKPAAFFKGILLPLAMENCTLKESMIFSSVITKASVPPMHAAAVIVRLCFMTPWYGTTSILLAGLIDKKYALPVKVIEALVAHFCSFGNEKSEHESLPVVWHRCLLLFAQRYKFVLNADQKRRLKELLRIQCHEKISPEINRELNEVKPGEAPAGDDQMES